MVSSTVSLPRGFRVMAADLSKFLAAYRLREVADGLASRVATGRRDEPERKIPTAIIVSTTDSARPVDADRLTRENVAFHIQIMQMPETST
jgi:DNA-binding GntR family transcriptional regulator